MDHNGFQVESMPMLVFERGAFKARQPRMKFGPILNRQVVAGEDTRVKVEACRSA
jgi:hypothetical protein